MEAGAGLLDAELEESAPVLEVPEAGAEVELEVVLEVALLLARFQRLAMAST